MALEWITQFYFPKEILELLKIEILPNIDFWMGIHFISGMLLFKLIGKRKKGLIIGLLVAYELFEQYLFQTGLATQEPTINIILDVIVGYMGYKYMSSRK